MDIDTVTQELNRRFAEPLREFYQRRIIFWQDEEREFESQLAELRLESAKLLILTGSNTFAAKKLLCEDDATSNYLVYNSLSFDRDDDDWLINVKLYSEEFHADLISIWMDEMQLEGKPEFRKIVKEYRKFFGASNRRKAVAKFASTVGKPSQLHLAILSAICGNGSPQPGAIIRAVLRAGLDMESNPVYQNLTTYAADKNFWRLVAQGTGYDAQTPELGQLAIHLLLTAASRTLHSDHLAGLEKYIAEPHQPFCYDLVSEWLHSDDNDSLHEIARYVEGEMRLHQRLSKVPVEDLLETECFPCVGESILLQLMTEICDHIIHEDAIRKAVQKRRSLVWYDELACYYDGLSALADMQAFHIEHSDGFHTVEPHKIWQEYTEDYYRMDTHYRKFHRAFLCSLTDSHPLLDDLFKAVAEEAEGLYSHWFLEKLGENWTTAAAANLKEHGRILEIPRQEEFYRLTVRGSDTKVYVIISDALRFEVATALADEMQRETRSKIKLSSRQAIFPTITPFGMAALLPHQKLTVTEKNGGLSVLADGMSTEANNRDKVLKNANPKSVALKYSQIIGLKRAERSELVKGMDVVYIYHDKIDEASHTDDKMVFPACDDAIAELKNLVKIIVNEFSGTKVYITADHGFLYTYRPLTENDKVDKSDFIQQTIDYGRRYAITRKGASPEYLLPVKFLDGNTDYEAFAPRENIRIKSQGGQNFVHGGISLQEMVVPVIEYQHLRSSSKQYQRNRERIDTKPVKIAILSASRKVSNMIFSLDFYQTEEVGANREAATYLLYFVDDSGKEISDKAKIIADKTDSDNQKRIFHITFHLKSQKYPRQDTYYLMIADENGLELPERIEFSIDIAFSVDGFDFFS